MTRVAAGGFVVIVLIQTMAFLAGPELALPAAGVAVAGFVLLLLTRLAEGRPQAEPVVDPAAESLQRWREQTLAAIAWADSSRGSWDRHLRPRLAREFMLAAGRKDPETHRATGRMVFGDDLWQWVDPGNVASADRDAPGPGRAALEDILRRLERL